MSSFYAFGFQETRRPAVPSPSGAPLACLSANAGEAGDSGSTLGQEDPLEQEMATYASTLAWKMPWTEEPDGLRSMGLLRVGHD